VSSSSAKGIQTSQAPENLARMTHTSVIFSPPVESDGLFGTSRREHSDVKTHKERIEERGPQLLPQKTRDLPGTQVIQVHMKKIDE
jgi:hypothetical protein